MCCLKQNQVHGAHQNIEYPFHFSATRNNQFVGVKLIVFYGDDDMLVASPKHGVVGIQNPVNTIKWANILRNAQVINIHLRMKLCWSVCEREQYIYV